MFTEERRNKPAAGIISALNRNTNTSLSDNSALVNACILRPRRTFKPISMFSKVDVKTVNNSSQRPEMSSFPPVFHYQICLSGKK